MFLLPSKRAAAVLLSLCLTACQLGAPRPPTEQALHFDAWQASGRASIRIDGDTADSKPVVQTLRINWQQQDEHYRIELSGSFGLGRTVIEGDQTGAKILRGGELLASSDDADALLAATTGVPLPIAYLRYWALGLSLEQHLAAREQAPADSRPALQRCQPDGACPLAPFSERGWAISFPSTINYRGNALPAKIIASSATMRLVIAIRQWSAPAAAVPATTFASQAQDA